MLIQAAAFAFVHLAHYGLAPLQPALIAVWVPSMFGVALVLGWVVRRSGSVWPAVLAHVVFNLGMNAVVFLLLPGALGLASSGIGRRSRNAFDPSMYTWI